MTAPLTGPFTKTTDYMLSEKKAWECLRKQDKRTLLSVISLVNAVESPSAQLLVIEMLALLKGRLSADLVVDLCKHSNPEVRMRAAELLDRVPQRVALEVLPVLAQDVDHLVRVSVMEILSRIGRTDSLRRLLENGLADSNPLVRSYAALGIGEIRGRAGVTSLQKRSREERHRSVKLSIYYSLYRLERKDHLNTVLGFLKNKDYRNRCAAANLLKEVYEGDRKRVIGVLKSQLVAEKTIAVKSSIESTLKKLIRLSGERK